MNALGIHTGRDLRGRSIAFLQEQFGKSGSYYFWIARGVDERPVRANRIRKSVGAETTFPEDLHAFEAMRRELRPLAEKVWAMCERSGTRGRTVTLKVKYADFEQITRSRSFPVSLRTSRRWSGPRWSCSPLWCRCDWVCACSASRCRPSTREAHPPSTS